MTFEFETRSIGQLIQYKITEVRCITQSKYFHLPILCFFSNSSLFPKPKHIQSPYLISLTFLKYICLEMIIFAHHNLFHKHSIVHHVYTLHWVTFFWTLWTVAHQAPLPWDFPDNNIGIGCLFLLQEIFPIQGSTPHLLHWQILYHWTPGEVCVYMYTLHFLVHLFNHWHWVVFLSWLLSIIL